MSFNAAQAYLDVREKYLDDVIDSTAGMFPNDGEDERWRAIRAQLKRDWASDNPETALFASPVIEPLFPYPDCGKHIDELIAEKKFDERMKYFVDEGLRKPEGEKGSYRLYRHQLDAICASRNKNIIVASGTGSGKTECFLYSMINNLLLDGDDFTQPGIRILMVYPMNALVKDQLKRIAELISQVDAPCIRVGMYTSEIREQDSAPRERWANDKKIKRHLVWDRVSIRNPDSTPHILITNYSMLEYMMLRASDRPIFQNTDHLKAVVLDEAHLYSGSLGIDINMLLRRVLVRFHKQPSDIRFYATSATIGDNKPETLRKAAAGLFSVPEDTVEAITGERERHASDTIVWNTGSAEDRTAAIALKRRVLASDCPGGFYQLKNPELELLGRIPPESVDENGRPFLPFKLHAFADSPRHFYSDMVMDGAHPLGHLRRMASKDEGGCVLEVFCGNNLRKEIYFRGTMVQDRGEARDEYILFSEANEIPGATVLFRFHSPLDPPNVFRFRLDPQESDSAKGRPSGWRVVEDGNGAFAFALPEKDNQQSNTPAVAMETQRWSASNGDNLLAEFVGTGDLPDELDDDDENDEVAGVRASSARYTNRGMLMPLGFMAPILQATLLTELVMPHLPDASLAPSDTRQLAELPWNGRQMLFFSDSRSRAATMAVRLQSVHLERLMNAYIYQWLAATGGPHSLEEIRQGLIDLGASSQLPLPQWVYDRKKDDANVRIAHIHDELMPGLLFRTIGIYRPGERSLEGLGAVGFSSPQLPEAARNVPGWEEVRDLCTGTTPEERANDWNNRVLPAIVQMFREMRTVYLHDFVNFRSNCNTPPPPLGNPKRKRYFAARRSLSILKNGLGYLASDLNTKMFATESRFARTLRKNLSGPRPVFERAFADDDERNSAINTLFNYLYALSKAPDKDGAYTLFVRGKNPSSGKATGTERAMAINAAQFRYEANPGTTRMTADGRTNKVRRRINETERDITEALRNSFGFRAFAEGGVFQRDQYGDVQFDPSAMGGMRVPEHSAQLDPTRLGELEELFRQHEINVISCTPTLEVGVDIGGLCAVVQSDLPPEKSNYLQRAGRAGRRGVQSAFVMTFLGQGMQDAEVLRDSLSFFRRSIPFSIADVQRNSAQWQVSAHLRQFLIGKFFQEQGTDKQNNNPLTAWETAGCFLGRGELLKSFSGYLSPAIDEYKKNLDDEGDRALTDRWLNDAQSMLDQVTEAAKGFEKEGEAKCVQMAGWLRQNWDSFRKEYEQILGGTVCEGAFAGQEPLEAILAPLSERLQKLSDKYNKSLGVIVAFLQNPRRGGVLAEAEHDRRMETALRHQFIARFREQLIQYLIHERVLPAYGFPVDVVSFSGNRAGISIQRGIREAIREFTPESWLTVGHEKFCVDVLAPNRYAVNGEPFESIKFAYCKDCGFIEVGKDISYQNKQACPRCETSASLRVRTFVQPSGYQSIHEPIDAAGSSTTTIPAKTQSSLILPNMPETNARITYQFIPAEGEDDKEDNKAANILWTNRGKYGNGFLIDTHQFWTISCPLGQDEDDWKAMPGVKEWLEKHPDYIKGHPDLACEAKVATWVCSIRTDQGFGGMSNQTCELLCIALQMEATQRLRLDSRVIQSAVDASTRGVIRFCLYETSGSSSVVAQLAEDSEGLLQGALVRLGEADTYEGRVKNLLSYSTDRALCKMKTQDFADAAIWARQFTCGSENTNNENLFDENEWEGVDANDPNFKPQVGYPYLVFQNGKVESIDAWRAEDATRRPQIIAKKRARRRQ